MNYVPNPSTSFADGFPVLSFTSASKRVSYPGPSEASGCVSLVAVFGAPPGRPGVGFRSTEDGRLPPRVEVNRLLSLSLPTPYVSTQRHRMLDSRTQEDNRQYDHVYTKTTLFSFVSLLRK